jgi:hypothetical protein
MKPAEAKEKLIRYIQEGKTVDEACRLVGKSEKTYEYYRKSDESFRQSVDHVRAVRARLGAARATGPFESFCPQYLGQQVFSHQLQWIDLLEGRRPRGLHPSMVFEPGRSELLICNTPPEHAKSTTITISYVTYRICQDPNVRIIVVSKTKEMAKKFVYAVKNRLTHPSYSHLQVDFAPADGFKGSADTWTTDMIYLGGDARDSGEKDPTLLALGMGGQIYGARADLIILDDCVTLANAHEYEKQIDWISQEVLTRLSDQGKLLVVGTRVAPVDLYAALRDPARYPDGQSPWTYFAQPAVLEFADSPEDWVTLWPQTNEGPDRLVPKWDGKALFRRRAVIAPRTWAMVYMQQQVVEDAVFPAEAVKGCINGMRRPGPMPRNSGLVGVRPEGMDGLYVVAGLDPAAAGYTAMVVMGVDRQTKKRWVLEVVNEAGMTPTALRSKIKELTVKYGIHEWRIEKNAFQTMLTQDAEVREFLASKGCVLKEHHTGNNKWDADFGVASMALLFDGWDEGRNLIQLPSTSDQEAVKALVEQLITWAPETKNKTDTVMALWFAEIRAREICDSFSGRYHLDNPYLTPYQAEQRLVVNLDDWFVANDGRQHLGYL